MNETDKMKKEWHKSVLIIILCAAVILLAGAVYSVCTCQRINAESGVPLRQVYVLTAVIGVCAVLVLAALILITCIVHSNKESASQNETDLRYRETLFSLLAQNTDYIFILFSPESFEAEYITPNIERVIGLKPEMIRKDIRKIACVLLNDISVLSDEILLHIPQGGCWQGEREMLHYKTGERRWYQEMLYRITVEGTEKCIMILSDCMEEHQLKETLENALSAAEAANRAKSNFLSNMSHDIRTPMNAIVGFTMLLGKDADQPEKVREYTRKITASSQHLLSLINDVLDMSKIESGKTTLSIAEFSMPELLENISNIILPQARAKEQKFEMHVTDQIPEILLGDALRVNQILINLLSNSVKYTQEGGWIQFDIRRLSQLASGSVRIRFEVSDNGIGMSEAFLEKIFDPFAREVNSTVNQVQGTGLGMPITKSIVELMGGTIQVRSRQGEGSVFTVEMEFAVPEQDRDKEFWTRNAISRALVVDDEEDICQMIQTIMEDTGVDVEYATSGYTAIEMVRKAREEEKDYHVILLDWKMPDLNGVETARRIRACVGQEVPILILTSYDWSEVEEEARAAGINAFMPKPFFVSTFWQTLEPPLEQGKSDEPKKDDRKDILDGLHFLVAEDNELNAEILCELLNMGGADWELASNGQEAVDLFGSSEDGHFDMILMDVQMPVMNGYDATRLIRGSGHPQAETIPIIAMTANAFAEDVKNAIEAGMNDHVAKPVDMDVLRSTLKKYRNR